MIWMRRCGAGWLRCFFLNLALTGLLVLPAPAGFAEVSKPAVQEPNYDTNNIHVLHVRGNVYMLVGAGCNITVQVGEQYVIVVDTGLPQFADDVIATVHKMSSLPIMFMGNTSSDADHTGGNAKFFLASGALPNATQGFAREEEKDKTRLKLLPGGTIVASLNTVNRTEEEAGKTTAIGFGDEGFKLYNNEGVVFYQMPKAHSDGDMIVFFRASDVVSAGDIFTTTSYPVIETENGGTVGGFIDALNDLIEILVPRYGEEGGTYVIPGHGHLSDRADVVNYRDMVTIIRGRIQEMVKNGMTLEQVKAAKPTLDYDGIYGADGGRKFTEIVYRELTKDTKQPGPK
jgi:glyoxylase-like metal-dependent hydrolase (beta-lactamase superfamily II)